MVTSATSPRTGAHRRGSRAPALLAVAVDVVIFTVTAEGLAVLLARRQREPFAGRWTLPGSFLRDDESPEAGAARVLRDRVGIGEVYIEQLYTFGRPERDPRGRVLSVGFFALMPWNRAETVARAALGTAWHQVAGMPVPGFDHAEIIGMAHDRLAGKLEYSTIALQLMPERFTLSQLQAVYEAILGEALDKRNFRKRIRAFDCIEPTGETYRAGKHRPARLYRLKRPGEVRIIK
mgnify:CR=1 FL=1